MGISSGSNINCGVLHSNAHSFGEFNLHLQFTPKKRRKVFENLQIQSACRSTFSEKAAQLGVVVFALEFGPDHVHVFLGGCKNYSVPFLAQHFKGYSSRRIRQAFPAELAVYNQGASLWSDGYFYETVGRVTSETVKFYIERHRKKHWEHMDYDAHCALAKKSERAVQTSLSSFSG